jgi:hypothetical protein
LTKPFLTFQANLKPSAALVSFDQALKSLPLKRRKSSSYYSFVLFSMGAWSKDTSAALGRGSCIWNQIKPDWAKNWPSGMYQLLLWADRKPLCSEKMIVQH